MTFNYAQEKINFPRASKNWMNEWIQVNLKDTQIQIDQIQIDQIASEISPMGGREGFSEAILIVSF